MKKYKATHSNLPQRESSLNLDRLNLRVLPLDKKYESISNLSLCHNQIQTLTNLPQFKSLTHLNLSSNRLESWTQLLLIRNPQKLKSLFIKGNPLENEPNYRLMIMKHFQNLERLDEMEVLPKMWRDFERLQGNIGRGLVDWVSSMVALEKYTGEMIGRRREVQGDGWRMIGEVRGVFKKHIPVVAEKQGDTLENFLLVSGYEIEQILIETSKVLTTPSRSRDHVQPVQYAFFTELLGQITKHNSIFVSYLLSQVQLDSPQQQQILINNSSTALQILFCEFKRLQSKIKDDKHTRTSSLQTDINSGRQNIDIFPYLSTEKYFVEAVKEIMMEIMQDNLGRIEQLEEMKRSHLLGVSQSENTSHVNESSSLLSDNRRSERSSLQIQIPMVEIVRHTETYQSVEEKVEQNNVFIEPDNDDSLQEQRQIPTSLAVTMLNILEAYQLKSAFNRIRKYNKHIPQRLNNLAIMFAIKRTIFLRVGLQAIREKYEDEINLQIEYSRLRLVSNCFSIWKAILQKKWLRTNKVKKLLCKKEKIEHAAKHFAFARWKIMTSKTLRYISQFKKSSVTHIPKAPLPIPQHTQRQIQRDYAKLRRSLKRTASSSHALTRR